jgi:hypothetical protein
VSDHLSADEMAYHARLVDQRRALDAVWASWGQHLAEKYDLGPQDGIDEHGAVMRGSAPDV